MSLPKTNTVITIGRQFGSAGLAIGRQVAKDLGLKLYYKEILDEITTEEDICNSDARDITEDNSVNSFLYSIAMNKATIGTYADMPINQKQFISQVETIKHIAKEGPCVLVGLCADYALAGNADVMSFFIHANMDSRIRRIARLYDVTDSKAKDMIIETDTKRNNYYNFYSNKKWGVAESYHMCLDSSVLGIDGTAEIIKQLIQIKENGSKKKL